MVNRGQLRILENVFSVFIIMFVFAIVMVLFFTSAYQSRIDELETISEQEALMIVRFVASMPEIQCVVERSAWPGCIDLSKVDLFRSLTKADDAYIPLYWSMLGRSRITVGSITSDPVVIYDELIRSERGIQSYTVPALIRSSTGDDLGWLTVEVSR